MTGNIFEMLLVAELIFRNVASNIFSFSNITRGMFPLKGTRYVLNISPSRILGWSNFSHQNLGNAGNLHFGSCSSAHCSLLSPFSGLFFSYLICYWFLSSYIKPKSRIRAYNAVLSRQCIRRHDIKEAEGAQRTLHKESEREGI